jgi:hypothetical protein
MRTFPYVAAYVLGIGLALVAAFTCSIGPEPPRTDLGKVLAVIYRPYFDLLCGAFGGVGFLIAVILSGLPFLLLVWLFFYLYDNRH